ncbi:glycosyltransferase family 4 protein [Rhodococcus sp. ANT_H53B]|uniref:glycosyltransferase family 4 protein n=1 Tax=Rhodococcus sp. ANT_H53B TaxID=2597357 RepID=UPI0011ED32DD|nr:glycosyltransferase family 4 protein [Rhodococcus sp. ANT_H53B]KAA0923622.1 glycosyltransferase family 4 protein [Rhodococcus sp. ANT_H53B]
MTVLFVVASLTTKSGLWNVMLAQARYLSARGTSVHLVCSARFHENGDDLVPDHFVSASVIYETESEGYRHRRKRLDSEILSVISRVSPTVVVSHTPQADLACYKICSDYSLRWLPVVHNWPLPDKDTVSKLKYFLWRIQVANSYCRAHSLVSVSQGLANTLNSTFRINSIAVVQNGVQTRVERKQSATLDPVFGFVGRLSSEKDPVRFVRLISQLDAKGVIAGAGRLEEDASNEILKSNADIDILGWVERGAVFDKIDVVVMPSLREGLPLVLLEACARGIPVVASNVGGVGDVLGSSALSSRACLVEAGASDNEWLARLDGMRDADFRNRVGTELADFVKENFDEQRQLSKFAGAVEGAAKVRRMVSFTHIRSLFGGTHAK